MAAAGSSCRGLIDCHCHVMLSDVNPQRLDEVPPTLMTAMAAPFHEGKCSCAGSRPFATAGGPTGGWRRRSSGVSSPGPRIFAFRPGAQPDRRAR